MKPLYFTLVCLLAIIILHSVSIAQTSIDSTAVDSLGYFPHWELVTDGKTTTSLYVTFLGPEVYGRGIEIFVRFFKEDGTPLENQVVQLYQANCTPSTVITTSGGLPAGGYVYFSLTPRQTAKLVLTTERLQYPLSFGYATMGWKQYPNQTLLAKFLAWAEVITIQSRFLRSAVRGEASVTVNGGSPFELRGGY